MRGRGERTALFLLPTDVMGGAENVLRMTAEAALQDSAFDRVVVFVLAGRASGSLDGLEARGAEVIHSGAASEKTGLPALVRQFAAGRYALVMSSHTHLNAAASAARAVGLLRTDRLVTRESTMAFERDLGRMGPVIRGLYRLYGAQDRIVCQTERMATSLSHHTRGRFDCQTRHLPNPIDLARHRVKPDHMSPRIRIAWCGRLAPVKSPHRALETLAALHSKQVDAELMMIGDGPLRSDLEDMARNLGLADRVTFAGRVDRPADHLRKCHLGLMTSDVEGFPNVILEMLAAGVRHVVTTDCAGGLADIPGVTVVREPTAALLATACADAADRARPQDVDEFLAARSPERFFESLVA